MFPDPADAPLTFVCVTVQVKVVPATFEVREMPVVWPLQIVSEEGVAVQDWG